MQHVSTVIEFFNDFGEVVHGVQYTGVMVDAYIYACKTSLSCGPDYIKLAINDTIDVTSEYRSIWEVLHRDIRVPEEVYFHDSRIQKLKVDQIPAEILAEIDSAMAERDAAINVAISDKT